MIQDCPRCHCVWESGPYCDSALWRVTSTVSASCVFIWDVVLFVCRFSLYRKPQTYMQMHILQTRVKLCMAKEKYCGYIHGVIQIKGYYIWFIIKFIHTFSNMISCRINAIYFVNSWKYMDIKPTRNNRYLTRGAESISWGLKHFGSSW